MYFERSPAAPLLPYVETLWYCEAYRAAHRWERVLPNGAFQLIVDLANPLALVCGMRTRYVVIDAAALVSVAGVLFRPGGARPFFDARSDEFFNSDVPLDLVWGRGARELAARLQQAPTPDAKFDVLDAELQARIAPRATPHSAVEYALGAFRRSPGMVTIASVTRGAGLSRRRFSQLFREQVGVTPKLYCRVRRFQQVVGRIASGAPVDWADVALGGGYSDQAHLAHEFREFSGISPGAYLAADRPYPNHVPID